MRKTVLFLLCLALLALLASSCGKKTTEPDLVATPAFSPPGGTYNTEQSVTITCATSGAEIRYTTDGSAPTDASTLYSFPLEVSANTTIKAKAFKDGWTASPTASAIYVIFTLPAQMVLIPGGTFHNGASNVTLSSFYISKFELMQDEYEAVMGVNPSYHPNVEDGPVENVTWFNAIEYCNRRSTMEGLTPCYSYTGHGTDPSAWPADWQDELIYEPYSNHEMINCDWIANGYRLPTEMEWEFAARGGNLTYGYTYSGSNDIDEVAWYDENSGNTTHAVGSKAPNELGLYDMSGNVIEMLWDIHDGYVLVDQTNPHGPEYGDGRSGRGGSWDYFAVGAEVTFRYNTMPFQPSYNRGFRLALNAP